MNDYTTLSTLISAGAIVLMLLSVYIAWTAYHIRKTNSVPPWLSTVTKKALPLLAAFTLTASALTLVYSEILGFVPCGLCWMERTMLYPTAIILTLAAWKRDRAALKYVIVLCAVGALIALYHHYLQVGGTSVLPCPASGNADCGKRLIYDFGFVTFPLWAFSTFIFTASLAAASRVISVTR